MDGWLKELEKTEIDVVGFPCNFGQGKQGTEKGPSKLREHGLIRQIGEMGFRVNDKGDLGLKDYGEGTFENVKKSKSVGEANKLLADAVEESLRAKNFCAAVGGDHCMAIGSIIGHARVQPNLGVIWVDAHADINPPPASLSGNAHGMPLAFLVHELQHLVPKLPGFEWVKPCIHARDIAYIGLRDVDDAEKEIIEKYKIKAFTMTDIVEMGITKVVQEAIRAISPSQKKPIHLSFDIDGLDPRDAASTGTPVPGGLMLREGVYIVETVASTGHLQMIDLAEVNPLLGSPEEQLRTLESACEIVGACFGKRNRRRLTKGFHFSSL